MKPENPLRIWQRLLHQPQKIWLRKVNFQIHLWAGIGAGLYIFVVSVIVTGVEGLLRYEGPLALATERYA